MYRFDAFNPYFQNFESIRKSHPILWNNLFPLFIHPSSGQLG